VQIFIKTKSLLFLLLFIFVSSCAGTGSKIKPSISKQTSEYTNLYFVRQGGYVAGGVLAKVEVNGVEVSKLGTKEYVSYKTSKNFKIKVSGAGIGGFGMGSDSSSGIADGKNYFYIISVKQGLFSAKFIINETTESGYNQAL
jgi:hypothetical protein|tara:strand:- start:110 stop:535 length:426 start_codon:yes stop_codon:yes gene_type:complete